MIIPPVLVIVFNRPHYAQKVFDALKMARVPKLFVSCDGARGERSGESALCEEVKSIFGKDKITWDCEVQYFYQEKNVGCKINCAQSIDWFFSQVEFGIILEDDCVPSLSFFHYAAILGEKFKSCERVMMLSGSLLVNLNKSEYDYSFSIFPCCWGWATWRRAWEKNDVEMADFLEWKKSKAIYKLFPKKKSVAKRVLTLCEKCYYQADGFNTTWDFQWLYAMLKNNGLCVIPKVNLVKNIGVDSTHDKIDSILNLSVEELKLEHHPDNFLRNEEYEDKFFHAIYELEPFYLRAIRKLKKLLSH